METTNIEYGARATNALLDDTLQYLGLKNDAALSRALEVAPPVISKLRHGRLLVGDSMVIRLHEATGWDVRGIKQRLGLVSLKRLSPGLPKAA